MELGRVHLAQVLEEMLEVLGCSYHNQNNLKMEGTALGCIVDLKASGSYHMNWEVEYLKMEVEEGASCFLRIDEVEH